MRRSDIRDLPTQTADEIAQGETCAVVRDGEVVGYFLPRMRQDPGDLETALDALDRSIQGALQNGYSREHLADDLDLSKPLSLDA